MRNVTPRGRLPLRRCRALRHVGLGVAPVSGTGTGTSSRCAAVSRGDVTGPAPHIGRTTPRISIEPAPAIVTSRPGRGACTIEPFPMYIPMWLASLK